MQINILLTFCLWSLGNGFFLLFDKHIKIDKFSCVVEYIFEIGSSQKERQYRIMDQISLKKKKKNIMNIHDCY